MRNIVLLGSSGSIGKSTLDVVRKFPDRLKIKALAVNSNIELLISQYHEFKPEYICVVDESFHSQLKSALSHEPVQILSGKDEMIRLSALADVDIVVNAIVGAAGLLASIETLKSKKTLALANKESLVTGGPLFPSLLEKSGAKILPIDSEHSAIFQALESKNMAEVKNLILTASGGPFRDLPKEKFAEITLEQALNHPTWKMGPKITIDSATLANKGLEVIEALNLFNISADKIKVVVHPQSIVHSMVEFVDSSILAQMSRPDMRMPITYALFWPERVESEFGQLDFSSGLDLSFEPPDFDKFPALRLAFEAARTGGTAPAIYNAANEIAVDAFLKKTISFVDIARTIDETLSQVEVAGRPSLDDIWEADARAREYAKEMTGQLIC
ncbi:MAG: 1-deoxy-D-xylulose-5-phosphate reductoisomerase [candidate division Zixibacteria bacterium]|nr:1-deoxy-D-xylulose-5-phosphate reductoisomerase [candidate division Zixibacteria bacterium]